MCFKSPCLERIKLALKILAFAFAPVQQVDKNLICHQRLRITGLPAGNNTAFGKRKAQPSGVTGKTFFDLCSSGGNNAAFLTCLMYIMTICLPEGLTTGEAAARLRPCVALDRGEERRDD